MNTKRLISALLLILLLAFSAYPALASSPAAEKTVKLVVVNKSLKPVQIRLTGAQNKTLTAALGKNIFELPSGVYEYEYTACGTNKSGELKLKGNGKLSITACKMANIKVVNLTGSNMYLYLRGPENYNLTLAPGITKVKVLAGTYSYTGTACGSSIDRDTQEFRGRGTWTWWCY